jgi:hypothetical protein
MQWTQHTAVWAVIPALRFVFTKLAFIMQTECCLFALTYMADKKNTARCKCENTTDRYLRLILHALLLSAFIEGRCQVIRFRQYSLGLSYSTWLHNPSPPTPNMSKQYNHNSRSNIARHERRRSIHPECWNYSWWQKSGVKFQQLNSEEVATPKEHQWKCFGKYRLNY